MDSYEQTLTAKGKVWNMLEKLKTELYQLDIAIEHLPESEVPAVNDECPECGFEFDL